MNFWKPLALVSIAVCVPTVGTQAARANPAPSPPPAVGMPQPHMQAALNALRTAQSELNVAEHNKGGWRERAVKDLAPVIADVSNGIAAGNQ